MPALCLLHLFFVATLNLDLSPNIRASLQLLVRQLKNYAPLLSLGNLAYSHRGCLLGKSKVYRTRSGCFCSPCGGLLTVDRQHKFWWTFGLDRCEQLLRCHQPVHWFLLSWRDAYCREFLPTPLRLYIQTSTLYFTKQIPLTFL